MLIWIIQVIIFSIILIFLVHNLILFFKSTLTVPKIKDLVNTSTQKYESMFNVISNKDNPTNYSSLESKDYSILDLLPKPEDTSMKSELKNFLKKQLTNSNINTNNNTNNTNNTNNIFSTEISAIDTMIGTNSYSDY